MDEHNLYFARSAIIGYLAVETWRVKTIIITILHIIIITTSILNLGSKTFAPKILAHTTCINRYWKYTQIFAAKSKQKLIAKTGKTYCENNWAELTAKLLNIGACLKYYFTHKMFASNQKCMRTSQNIRAHEIFAPMKYYLLIHLFQFYSFIIPPYKIASSWHE